MLLCFQANVYRNYSGVFFAKLIVLIINKIRLEYDSLYVVITIAGVLLTYSFISIAGGNGFIGVYVCGLVMSGLSFVNKNSLIKFHDAVAWLMQIIMFVILGLLVNFKSGFVYTKQAFLLAMVLILLQDRRQYLFVHCSLKEV